MAPIWRQWQKNAGSGSSSHDIGQETQARGESGVAGKSSTHSSQYDSSGSEDSEDESRSFTALVQQLREQKSAKRKQPDGEENEGSGVGCDSSDDEPLQNKQARVDNSSDDELLQDNPMGPATMVSVLKPVTGTRTTTV